MQQLNFFDKTLDSDSENINPALSKKASIRKVHCFFEQSGTFKNEFIKLGIPAFDYDIQNEFEQTDYVIDLFAEIEKAYEDKPSIFDDISEDDLIFAFFPCIRFENQIMLFFRGQASQQKKWTLEEKMRYDMDLLDEVNSMYKYVNHLFITCIRRNIKLIMENPYSKEHFLRRYWCYSPSIIDKDRRENGDYFAKPTQYWFLNCTPKDNLVIESITYNAITSKKGNGDSWANRRKSDYQKTGAKNIKTARSMIHPQYARRFILQYIL